MTDAFGKRYRKQFPTKKAAEHYDLRIRSKLSSAGTSEELVAQDLTVAQCIDLHIAKLKVRVATGDGLRHATFERYCRTFDNYVRPLLGNWLLRDLTERDVQKWVDTLTTTRPSEWAAPFLNRRRRDGSRPRPSPDRPLGKAVAGEALWLLRDAIENARRNGFVNTNVIRTGQIELIGRGAGPRHAIPSKAEIRALLQAVDSMAKERGKRRPQAPYHRGRFWFRPFVYIAIFAGLRQCEIRALRWEDVDLDGQRINVERSADRKGRIGDPKSKAGRRTVPMAPSLLSVLREWKLACPNRGADSLCFPTPSGSVLESTTIDYQWWRLQAAVKGAGGGHDPRAWRVAARRGGAYRWHDLRHVAASLFIDVGLPPKRIQNLMGHASIQMTFDLYGHLFEDEDVVRNAMSRIGVELVG